jgi:lactoylglutathione lyase
MAKILGLAHVGIMVSDIERSKAFYSKVLGFECIWQSVFTDATNTFTCGFMKNGDLVLELVMRKVGDPMPDGVVEHLAMKVDNIVETRKMLEKNGIQFETEDQMFCKDMFPNGTKWVFFRGPDGEHLELSQIL